MQSKKMEIQSWIDELSSRQRAHIKEVCWKVPDDEDLHEYLRQRGDELIKCPNRFCGLYFEKILVDSKKKAPLVLVCLPSFILFLEKRRRSKKEN